jgi:hypothetical protein
MMVHLKEKINELKDSQVVGFLEYFTQELLSATEVSLEEIQSGIPDTIRALAGFSQIENLTPDQAEYLLDLAASAPLARHMLLNLTEDKMFAGLIEQALGSYRDNRMIADIVLAVGLAASLILLVATTEFEGEVFGIRFKKGKADIEMVKTIIKPLTTILQS